VRGDDLSALWVRRPGPHHIPPEQRQAFEAEMRAAGVDWRMHLYGGAVHSVTNPEADGSMAAIEYDHREDERSWRSMLDRFARCSELDRGDWRHPTAPVP
jgi:dienelactone hydrolase